jgi:Carboxypeptidase regulatory-like domain
MKPYLLVTLIFLLAFHANPQQPLVGSIQGTVKDQRGVPLADAVVTATNIDAVEPETYRHTASTDKDGTFQFIDLSPGRFSIMVQKRGYRDYTIDLVNLRPGEAVKIPEIKISPLHNSK